MTGVSDLAASGGEQLRRLREQAGALMADRVAPAASDAAAHAAEPLKQVLSYLPMIAEYGVPIIQALRRTTNQAEQAVVPRKKARTMARLARPAVIAGLVLGTGYLAYRIGVRRAPSANSRLARRSAR